MVIGGTDVDGAPQYDITVRTEDGSSQVYRTLASLYDGGGTELLGRGTRVWKAVKLEEGVESGDPVALKDSWVDEHLKREGFLNQQIRSSAATLEDRKAVEDTLVEVVAYGDVYISDAQDRTRPIVRGAFRNSLRPRVPHVL